MFKINNVELEFDFMDMDEKEYFNECFKNANDKIKELSKVDENKDDTIFGRKYCEIIIGFFEEIFGEDKTYEIFEGKANLRKCTLAIKDLVKEKIRQDIEFQNLLKEVSSLELEVFEDCEIKLNREQRRAKKRKSYKN